MIDQLACGDRRLSLDRVAVMGVLNLTPDSFSDGGDLLGDGGVVDADALLRRADLMVTEGAAILDLGAESTRPGAAPVPVAIERERIVLALELLKPRFDVVLSVDSSAPEVYEAAVAAGAGMLNDVRALRRPGALEAAAATGLPVCLMHMQGEPGTMQDRPAYEDVVGEVSAFLRARMAAAQDAGIGEERLLVDPGFGFGKTLDHNCELLRELPALRSLGVPMLVGLSRKRMIGALTGREVGARVAGSIAAAALAVRAGARLVRTHDVAETVDAVRVAEAVRG
ncbi:MAG: dihydropteroate synthase [Pseudomonadales bacterium]|nr:dihydropteroate synthase [Pseudomonadales bacterium]